jgi:Xaa-Pro dipeptidase
MRRHDAQKRALLKGIMASGVVAASSADGAEKGHKTQLVPPLTGYNDDYKKPFSELEYAQRLQRLRSLMADAKVDVLNVSSPQGMCYLHGYAATWYAAQSATNWIPCASTFVHVDRDELLHFDSDFEEGLIAATSIVKDPVFIPMLSMDTPGLRISQMMKHLKTKGWLAKGATVGMERYSVMPSPALSAVYEAALRDEGFRVVDGTLLIRGVQKVKSPQELAYIRQAAEICTLGHQAIIDSFQDGITQLELWSNALHAMYRAGGEPASLLQGVFSGKNFSGHDIPSTRRIRKGEPFAADLCGVVHRYHANIMRTYYAGDPPTGLARLISDSAGAFPALANVARPGVKVGKVIAELARYNASTASSKDYFYMLGYELGIAFPPDWVNEWTFSDEDSGPPRSEQVFEARTVTNFESIYWHHVGAARRTLGNIDTLLYDSAGTEVLGSLPRTIISVA